MTKVNFNKNGDHLSLALRWLAGEVESPKYEKLLASSVGLGLTTTVTYHAQRLCHLHGEEIEIEIEGQLLELLHKS